MRTLLVLFLAIFSMAGVAMSAEKLETAIFAGGCFWCMEYPFESRAGVKDVTAGYTGGKTQNPTYQDICSGFTGHYEAVRVTFDPSIVSYAEIIDIFWRNIDPTDKAGQFADRGTQYRTAIFYTTPEQKLAAEKSKKALADSGKFNEPITTAILPAGKFYDAEDYHQDYYKKNPAHYNSYKIGSGRAGYIDRVWKGKPDKNMPTANWRDFKKPSQEELKTRLTPMQYKVTQGQGTEKAFTGDTWDNKRDGIYVDAVSGEPLFSSKDKYDSGTGWPSFTKPLMRENIVTRIDKSLFDTRTEVRSKRGDSHLGHVFEDGPAPTGMRYCMNSASLRFIPKEDMEKEGYGEFLSLFE